MDEKYDILRMIGEGAFGKVFLGRRIDSESGDDEVAIKVVNFENPWETIPGAVLREAGILLKLQHDCITRLFDVYSDEYSVHFVIELMDKTLLTFLGEEKLDLPLVKKFLRQILKGLSYMHELEVMHRDITPANILLDCKKENVKIADFGLARLFSDSRQSYTNTAPTELYMAPEQLIMPCNYSCAVDVWAAGCIFAEMVIGEALFYDDRSFGDSCFSQLLRIFTILGAPTEDTWPGISQHLICHHVYKGKPEGLEKYVPGLNPVGRDLLQKMLCINPSERITASEALEHSFFQCDAANYNE